MIQGIARAGLNPRPDSCRGVTFIMSTWIKSFYLLASKKKYMNKTVSIVGGGMAGGVN